MYFLGLSLNVLSMMGLLLGVGMVVDNAVVAVESIYQQRARFPDDPPKAAILGVRQVAIALTAGTLCHCIVFLPNIFGQRNFISIYLSHVAFAITISLLASWLVAVSLVPMLSARIAAPKFIQQDSVISRWVRRYEAFVRWTLEHRGKTVLAGFLLLAVSMVPAKFVKFDMFPSGETRRLNLNYNINGNYRLEELERNVFVIEKWLLAHKDQFEIRSVYSYISEDFGPGTDILLHEDEKAKRPSTEIMEEIRKQLPKIAIGTVGFGFQNRGTGNAMQITVQGDSNEVLHDVADALIPVLSQVKGVRDARLDEGSANREISVRVDRARAAYYGFSAQEVATYISVALRGAPLREFRNQDHEVPVWLRFQDQDKASVDNLADYKLQRKDGTNVPLMALVEVRTTDSPASIGRANRQTAVQIKINLDDKTTTTDDARKEIDKAMKAVPLPPGYRWTFGGGFDDDDQAGAQMAFNTLIALVMIYVVMAAVFESLLFPAAILTTILFSIFGVFWLFWLTGTTFSIMASIGILVLMGVVVNNGIVMVEHINQLRAAGQSRTDALAHGCRDRLRPILMTMGTAILGMLPICISSTQIGGNGPPYFPMARAIVGGLIFSTLVTLALMPTIYAILDDWRENVRRLFRQARAPRAKPGAIEATAVATIVE
jgi:HAE1 family hydrophobic/amphiphilic exporter-1